MAYYSVEPFGEERADFRAGVIASALVNLHLKKGRKPLTPYDFMYFTEARLQKESAELLSERLKADFSKLPMIDKRRGTARSDTD